MNIKIGKFPKHYFWHSWFGYSPEQRVKIKIHKWDTWGMDHTLAPIIPTYAGAAKSRQSWLSWRS